MVDPIGDLLPQALEANLEIHSFPRQVPNAEKLFVTRTPSFPSVSVDTLVDGLPGRAIGRLFVGKDCDMYRPGGDNKQEVEQTTVSLVSLGPISLMRLRFRRAVGPG